MTAQPPTFVQYLTAAGVKYYFETTTKQTTYKFPSHAVIIDAKTKQIIYTPSGLKIRVSPNSNQPGSLGNQFQPFPHLSPFPTTPPANNSPRLQFGQIVEDQVSQLISPQHPNLNNSLNNQQQMNQQQMNQQQMNQQQMNQQQMNQQQMNQQQMNQQQMNQQQVNQQQMNYNQPTSNIEEQYICTPPFTTNGKNLCFQQLQQFPQSTQQSQSSPQNQYIYQLNSNLYQQQQQRRRSSIQLPTDKIPSLPEFVFQKPELPISSINFSPHTKNIKGPLMKSIPESYTIPLTIKLSEDAQEVDNDNPFDYPEDCLLFASNNLNSNMPNMFDISSVLGSSGMGSSGFLGVPLSISSAPNYGEIPGLSPSADSDTAKTGTDSSDFDAGTPIIPPTIPNYQSLRKNSNENDSFSVKDESSDESQSQSASKSHSFSSKSFPPSQRNIPQSPLTTSSNTPPNSSNGTSPSSNLQTPPKQNDDENIKVPFVIIELIANAFKEDPRKFMTRGELLSFLSKPEYSLVNFAKDNFRKHYIGNSIKKNYLTPEEMLSFSDKPLLKPLLKKIKPELKRLAETISTSILQFMGTIPGHNQIVVARNLSNIIQVHPELVDETFFQIIKQTINNPNPKWTEKGYLLFIIIATLFRPKKKLRFIIMCFPIKHLLDQSWKVREFFCFCLIKYEGRYLRGNIKDPISIETIKKIPIKHERASTLFDCSIFEIMWFQRKKFPKLLVPIPLLLITKELRKKNVFGTKNLLDLQGNQLASKQWAADLTSNYKALEDGTVADLMELLKYWLQMIIDPIIPRSSFNAFLHYETETDYIKMMPTAHMNSLKYLIGFFQEIIQHSSENQSSLDKIAEMFGQYIANPYELLHSQEIIDAIIQKSINFLKALLKSMQVSDIYPIEFEIPEKPKPISQQQQQSTAPISQPLSTLEEQQTELLISLEQQPQ